MQQRYGLQGCPHATLVRTAPGYAEADAINGNDS